MAGRRQLDKMNKEIENTDPQLQNSDTFCESIVENLGNMNLNENEVEHISSKLCTESQQSVEANSNETENIQGIPLKSLNTSIVVDLEESKSNDGLISNVPDDGPVEICDSNEYFNYWENQLASEIPETPKTPPELNISTPIQKASTSKHVSFKNETKDSLSVSVSPEQKQSSPLGLVRLNGSGILGEEMSPIHKSELPLPEKPTSLNLSDEEMNLMYPNSTDKLEQFYMDQTIETLLEYCYFSELDNLIKIWKILRTKLQMDIDIDLWEEISLPENFSDLLENLSLRVHHELDDHARVVMFKLFLDLMKRYQSYDEDDSSHIYVNFFFTVDQRLDFHFTYEEEKSEILLEEFEVLMELNEYITRNHYKFT